MTDTIVHAAAHAALWFIAVQLLALLVLLAAYVHETRQRARAARHIETLYSARCPADLDNTWS